MLKAETPLGIHTLLDPEIVAADLNTARELVALIRYKLALPTSPDVETPG